jgi:arylsulfatase A-like enzyme
VFALFESRGHARIDIERSMKKHLALALVSLVAACGDDTNNGMAPDLSGADFSQQTQPDQSQMQDMTTPVSRRVIVFVWDGLRPDSVSQADTPNLYALKMAGVDFLDNHSTYPTFTMMNAAAFATGSFPGTTGFYGNTLWQQGPTGNTSAGTPADFTDPIFTEDYGILQDLDAFYNNQLLLVGTLFQAAQSAGLSTAAVGKSGPAFLQDYKKGGFIIDEKTIFPLTLVKEIQQAGESIPATTPFAYPAGMVTLGSVNGNPTAQAAKVTLADKTTSDPTNTAGAPTTGENLFMMRLYINHVLPKNPDLSLIWFRTPDSPEHNYGPGAPDYHDALKQQDILLGMLEDGLKKAGLDGATDIIVVSDHGHSNVSGPIASFPLRDITAPDGGVNAVAAIDNTSGWSVSGDVRMADLLTRAGFASVYDGNGCLLVPVMSGIKTDGTTVYTTQTDAAGTICGKVGTKYTTASFVVPAGALPAKAIVIATNGGSDYIYVPDGDTTTVANVVKFLQSRDEVGPVFLAAKYGALDGTLPLDSVKLEHSGRSPDIIFSYTWDDQQQIAGVAGIEFESMSASSNRGMHGSFSPIDVHNTLLARGPDFKTGVQDTLPTGNVDVAPTVATILSAALGKNIALPQADGRPLLEALVSGGANVSDYTATPSVVTSPTQASGITFQLPTNPATPGDTDTTFTQGKYGVELHIKTLTKGTTSWKYFDFAKAVRQ